MSLRLNRRHMSQPTGWAFPLSPEHTLLSEKLDELVEQLRAYRVNNGLPVGDPEHDIAIHYSPQMPWLILDGEPLPVEAVEADRATQFVNNVWATSPHPRADQQEREKRWEQCKACPQFQPLPALGGEAVRRVMVLSPWLSELEHGYCRAHQWVCSVAVGVKEPGRFASDIVDATPCWVLNSGH